MVIYFLRSFNDFVWDIYKMNNKKIKEKILKELENADSY